MTISSTVLIRYRFKRYLWEWGLRFKWKLIWKKTQSLFLRYISRSWCLTRDCNERNERYRTGLLSSAPIQLNTIWAKQFSLFSVNEWRLYHKLCFYNHDIFATQCRTPQIFQSINFIGSNILNIRKFEFVTQFLHQNLKMLPMNLMQDQPLVSILDLVQYSSISYRGNLYREIKHRFSNLKVSSINIEIKRQFQLCAHSL